MCKGGGRCVQGVVPANASTITACTTTACTIPASTILACTIPACTIPACTILASEPLHSPLRSVSGVTPCQGVFGARAQTDEQVRLNAQSQPSRIKSKRTHVPKAGVLAGAPKAGADVAAPNPPPPQAGAAPEAGGVDAPKAPKEEPVDGAAGAPVCI